MYMHFFVKENMIFLDVASKGCVASCGFDLKAPYEIHNWLVASQATSHLMYPP